MLNRKAARTKGYTKGTKGSTVASNKLLQLEVICYLGWGVPGHKTSMQKAKE